MAVALLAAGCQAGVGAADRATPTTTQPSSVRAEHTTSRSQPGVSDRKVITAAYLRFWSIASTVDSLPQAQWRPTLTQVATDPLLTRIVDGLVRLHAAGRRQYGRVVPHPTVIEHTPTRASVLDCQDASASGEADIDTGLPATTGSSRTAVAAVLVRGADGDWRLAEARYLPDAC